MHIPTRRALIKLKQTLNNELHLKIYITIIQRYKLNCSSTQKLNVSFGKDTNPDKNFINTIPKKKNKNMH